MIQSVEHCYSFVIFGDIQKYFNNILLESSKLEDSGQYVFCVFVESEEVRAFLMSDFNVPDNYVLIVVSENDSLSKLPIKLVRYFAHNYVRSNFYHVRDADHTNINQENFLLGFFFRSEYKSLIVRSGVGHLDPISAGLFSYKKSLINEIDNFQKSISNRYLVKILILLMSYRYDQALLGLFLYPHIRGDSLILSNFSGFSGENTLLVHSDYLDGWRD